MKTKYLILSLILIMMTSYFFVEGQNTKPEPAQYGERMVFGEHVPLVFPDFQLTYIGTTETSVSHNLKIVHYNFVVESNGNTENIAWSSGLGEIAPKHFEVNQGEYVLELKMSESLGNLQDNEIVVSKI